MQLCKIPTYDTASVVVSSGMCCILEREREGGRVGGEKREEREGKRERKKERERGGREREGRIEKEEGGGVQ